MRMTLLAGLAVRGPHPPEMIVCGAAKTTLWPQTLEPRWRSLSLVLHRRRGWRSDPAGTREVPAGRRSGLTPHHGVRAYDPGDAALVELRVATQECRKPGRVRWRRGEHPSQARCRPIRGLAALQQATDRRMINAGTVGELSLGHPPLLQRLAHPPRQFVVGIRNAHCQRPPGVRRTSARRRFGLPWQRTLIGQS